MSQSVLGRLGRPILFALSSWLAVPAPVASQQEPNPRVEVAETGGPDWKLPAAIGAVVGAGGTYLWLHSGGSTSLCDRSRNQDAMGRRECVAVTVLGGAVGAGVGVLVSKLLRTERGVRTPLGRVRFTIDPVLR